MGFVTKSSKINTAVNGGMVTSSGIVDSYLNTLSVTRLNNNLEVEQEKYGY
jgi:hypothetical protein